MKLYLLPKETPGAYVNSIEAWVPQYWANESIAILVENLQMAALVYRDFENIIADSGDTVNTRKPGEFKAKNKTVTASVAIQDAIATNIPIVLNQHIYVTFLIRDREQARAFEDLVQEYLKPAMIAIARRIDRILLGQAPRFLRTDGKTAGQLGVDASIASMLATRKNLNNNKCPLENRNLIISSKDEAALLALDTFINAAKVGDDGTSLREASLGRRLGFDVYMCQNTCSVTGTSDTLKGAINAGNLTAGSTVLTTNSFTGAVVTGAWVTIAGDMIPHTITAHSETLGNTTQITITPPLAYAILNAAIVTAYTPGAVDQSGTVSDTDGNVINAATGYPAGWEMVVKYKTFTNDPQIGQIVQFVAAGDQYVVVDVDTTAKTMQLDRPLVVALADSQAVFLGPNGTYNLGFHQQAIALVTRPMALPRAGTGAVGAVANWANLSVRVVWAYDYKKQGMAVTVDVLCGVAVLEPLKGEVMLG
jgi:hypothetical protein